MCNMETPLFTFQIFLKITLYGFDGKKLHRYFCGTMWYHVVPCEFQKHEKIISKYWKNTMHDNIICFDEDDTYHTFFDPSFKSIESI